MKKAEDIKEYLYVSKYPIEETTVEDTTKEMAESIRKFVIYWYVGATESLH